MKREQLRDHEERVQSLEGELEDHRRHPPDRSAKSLNIQNYKEKDAYLHYEVNSLHSLQSYGMFVEIEVTFKSIKLSSSAFKIYNK